MNRSSLLRVASSAKSEISSAACGEGGFATDLRFVQAGKKTIFLAEIPQGILLCLQSRARTPNQEQGRPTFQAFAGPVSKNKKMMDLFAAADP